MSHCVSYLCVILAETPHLAASRHAELRGLSLAASHRATEHRVKTVGVWRCQAHGKPRTGHTLNDHLIYEQEQRDSCNLYSCVDPIIRTLAFDRSLTASGSNARVDGGGR